VRETRGEEGLGVGDELADAVGRALAIGEIAADEHGRVITGIERRTP
jgi:hypothetical protein